MKCAGVKECWRGGAETTALVEVVEAQCVTFAVILLVVEEAHGDTDPEILWHFEADVLLGCLIDDQVAVIHGLHTKVIEVEVGRWIERCCDLIDIEVEQLRVDAVDLDRALKVWLEGTAVCFFEAVDTVADDVPLEHFFVDVSEKDTACKLSEVGIFLDHALGIENDGLLQVLALHLWVE